MCLECKVYIRTSHSSPAITETTEVTNTLSKEAVMDAKNRLDMQN